MTISPKTLVATGFLALSATVSLAPSASAQVIACGGSYTVKAGDTLSLIAQRAYNDASAFQVLFSANSTIIGPNPSLIKLGDTYDIPCLDNQTASTAPVLSEDLGPERLPFPDQREIRIVTATDWAPFLDEDQEQGGMLAEMVNVAMSNSQNKTKYKIDFVNDWSAHLTPMITDMAYDFSIAWFKPNCEQIDRLAEDSQFRCNNFDWTNITLERPTSPTDCFNGLMDGSYDVVAIATDTAVDTIAELGIADRTRHDENLGQVLTLHGVISKNHPQGNEMLAEFNSGLQKIKSSGEWFQIVLRHLQEHKAKTN